MPSKNPTERARGSMRQIRRTLIALVVFLLVAALVAVGSYVYPYTIFSRPFARLHQETDLGYIAVSASGMDFSISAPQAFVYDMAKQEILWTKGEERVLYPASITKLWSILTALQVLSPDETVTVSEEVELIASDSSRAYIQKGHILRVDMLIEGMLLPSGNDAAYALAAAAGRKLDPSASSAVEQIEVFIQQMNDYAAECGLCGTVFTTPDGLADREHYTTVEDMILICRMAMEQPLIARYAAMAQDSVEYESSQTNTWVNTNQLLQPESAYYRPGVIGLKTGSLAHNYCVIAAYECDETTYLIGIFGAWDRNARFEDACTIIDALAA